MKLKKLFALALAVCMMVSVMPTSFAGNGFLSLDGAQPTTTTSGPSLTLDNPGTVSGGSVVTPSVSQSSQSVYTPYVYSNPYGVSSVADEGEGETTPAAPKANDTEVLSEGGSASAQAPINLSWTGSGTGQADDVAEAVTNDKVGTAKSIVTVDDKEYLRLESYVTGSTTTTTVTSTKPMDVVLVLDQSGSMTDEFETGVSRQIAMKNAVNAFIGAVHDKYSNTADHRISIVTFGTTATQVADWTFVNDSGNEDLQGKVTALEVANYATYTNVALGMQLAEGLMNPNSGYSYTGLNTDREKVVILFTDGVPTSNSTQFDIAVANTALGYATSLKGSLGCTIYTVGIFSGANPNELYGSKNSSITYNPTSDGSIGSSWAYQDWGFFVGLDFQTADLPAGNRFLNYLSSNYNSVSELGLSRSTEGLGLVRLKVTYTISKTETAVKSTYYKAAANASELNSIFTDISNTSSEGGASISLNETTKVTDVISDYFKLPAGTKAENILVYTADYIGSNAANITASDWDSDKPLTLKEDDIIVDPANKTVSVKGFDFAENYVGIDNVNNEPKAHGKKLVILIPIEKEAAFLGGNDVVTNAPGSGVLGKESDGTYTMVETFVSPTKDIAIPAVSVEAVSKNIYLSHTMSPADMLRNATIKIGGVTLDLSKADFGLSEAQRAYLKSITLDANNNENGTFTISCKVTTTDDNQTVIVEGSQSVTVFKPHITFNDSTIYLGVEADYGDNHNDPCVVWLDDDDNLAQNMTGDEPSVTVTYDQPTGYFTECEDISVKTVELGGTEVALRDVTFENDDDENANHHFTVHVLYPSVNYQNSTVHLGFAPTADYHKANNLVSDGKFITWADKNTEHGIASETGNDDSSFNYSFTPVDTALTECTPVTATITVKTLPDVTADEDIFTVHVVRPTITFADQVIYLSKQPDYINLDDAEEVASAFAWNTTCTEGTAVGSTTDVPAVTGTVATADFKINYDKPENDPLDPFLDCTPVNATVQFGSGDDAPDYTAYVVMKNGDTVCGANDSEFTVHVLKPDFAVSGTDLYADYGTNLGLDYQKDGQDYQAIAWSNEWKCATESCEDVKDEEDFIGDDADKATVSQVVYDVAHTPENAGVLTQNSDTKKWSYTVKTDDDDFTVELKEFKIGNITYDSENWAGVTYDGDATNDQATFTIYVNKFQLTIKTDWTKSSGEQQSAIFTVTPDNTDLMPIKVVVPKGVNSVVVAGLFSGQEYTIAEDNGWTWRYGTAADVVYGKGEDRIACVGGLSLKALNGTDEVTMSFDDGKTYNAKWLADEACVINKATTQATTINPTLSVKKKDEEVTGA